MQKEKAVKKYQVQFKRGSDNKVPASYWVYVSAPDLFASLYTATVIAANTDTPEPEDANRDFWNRVSQESIEGLCVDVDNELMHLNPGREIHYEGERW